MLHKIAPFRRFTHMTFLNRGAPLTLIEGLTLCDNSLGPAWDTLVARYENKSVLLNDQLDYLADLVVA